MKIRFLGTGAAGGIPLFGCQCRACRRGRQITSYRRESACLEVSTRNTRLVIDAGVHDLGRRYSSSELDSILLTHYHMDHVQGLFPMRWGRGCQIPVIGPDDARGADDLFKHPGVLDFSRKATAFEPFAVGQIRITPLPLNHSRPTLGYVLESNGHRVAYLTDTVGLPETTRDWLRVHVPDLLVIDSTYPPTTAPRNHNDLSMALTICEEIGAHCSLLTHISDRLECWLMENELIIPDGVGIARDGLELDLETDSLIQLPVAVGALSGG